MVYTESIFLTAKSFKHVHITVYVCSRVLSYIALSGGPFTRTHFVLVAIFL